MNKSFISLILNMVVLLLPLHAQPVRSLSFVHFGVGEGLSQNTIFGITQDKQGNMWFATYDGLNKYDGYDFTVYQHDDRDPHSIGSSMTKACMADSEGNIWVGTQDGLSVYDAAQDKFYNYTHLRNKTNTPITGIVEINAHQLLLFVGNGEKLLQFDTRTRQFSEAPLHPSLQSILPTTICRQGNDIYIGTYSGLFVYSIFHRTLKNVGVEILRGKQVISILEQSPTCLWVGTEGDGLYKINPQTKEVTAYTHIPGKSGSISSNYIRSLKLDSQNVLWVGTINSLNLYDEKTDSFHSYADGWESDENLSQTSVRHIFRDNQGGMWLGTYYGGLSYYHPLKNRFHNIQSVSDARENSLSSNVVGCIRVDAQKNIWVGTNKGGLNHYDAQAGKFTHYMQKNGLASNDIKAIYIDEAQNLVYIGTHTGGLSILHRNTGRIETFNNRNLRNIYDIQPAANGDLWLTCATELLRFDVRNKTFSRITTQSNGQPLEQGHFYYTLRDSKQRLWLSSEPGLDVYLENANGLLAFPLFPDSFPVRHKVVNALCEARNGVFWIGTRSGLYRFDEKKQEYKQYISANGLPNNVIHGILEDASGCLWLSTNKGLSCFNPQTEKFRNYTDYDGLQSNQFTNNAYCQTADGKMFFGGINGITTFQPEQIVDNTYAPPVVITRLRLFNQTVFPNDSTGILKQDISRTKTITLSSKQSMFSLDFVVSNYVSGHHNTFAYMLQGYDKKWYYSNTLRTAFYSNLPAGTYRFLVKAANSDGKWNEVPTELEIVVLPVWYKTWWAFLLFVIAFVSITTFIFYYFWMRKSMKAELQMERVDKERQKEVNEMKLRFFINISHELRTPLTLILAPVQEMLNVVNDRWLHKQLEYVQKNTNRLLHLVNQLMDYRRAELGVFNLKVRPNLLHDIIKKDFLFYDHLAKHKNISYDFHSYVEGHEILCDPDYMELIVNNLLSNAFKYTGEGKSITVTLKEKNHELLLQVKDTGSGIPLDKQGKIFERFYQVDAEHQGSGIGLSLVQRLVDLHHGRIELESREGVGSTFSVYVPTEESAYLPQEKQGASGSTEEQRVYTTNDRSLYVIDTEKEEVPAEPVGEEGRHKEKILIVEDDAGIRQYLGEELGKHYHTLVAGNGKEAMAVLKEQEVDLILTDVMMPVMNGLQLCKQIKQNLNTCHIPIIMLSAKADLKEQLEGLQVGADDYISKPFSMAVMVTKIKNLFRTRHQVVEHYAHSLEVNPEKVALNPLDEDLLKKAVDIVERNIDNVDFSTDDFAREMCMSRSNLHLKLKALTGEPANNFIRKIRFNRACKLLKEGRYTIAEISSMVGFNTPSYFAASFKKFFGCLPSEYGK